MGNKTLCLIGSSFGPTSRGSETWRPGLSSIRPGSGSRPPDWPGSFFRAGGSGAAGRILASLVFAWLTGCGEGGSGVVTPTTGSTAGVASLSWTAPTDNADGTLLTDLLGFKIYYGGTAPVTKASSQSLDVGNVTAYTLNGLAPGSYYFSVTAYDADGNESAFATEVGKTVS